jgi:hypothetical protein
MLVLLVIALAGLAFALRLPPADHATQPPGERVTQPQT